MTISRRNLLIGSGLLLLFSGGVAGASRQTGRLVHMQGSPRGARVWFEPLGLAVDPGTTLTFMNQDPSNSHTVTAYHPEYFDRVRRIPAAARAFHSGYLLPDEEFRLTLTVPGVYDYYCVPHELAGMVGRILVGTPDMSGWDDSALSAGGVVDNVTQQLPPVHEILQNRP